MANGIRDLKVWQEAVALGGDVLRAMRQHGRRELRAVTDIITESALGAASHIAEGYGRYTAPEQRQLYRAARRDLLRLETQLAVARRAEILPPATLAELSERIQSVSRLLGGYLVYLERQVAAEDPGRGEAPPRTPAA